MAYTRGLDEKDREDISEQRRIRAPVVYEIVRQEGVVELERPVTSLWWSGIAAGLAISVSAFGEGLFRAHLPEAPWRPLVENFGYCLGFLLVMLGGFQLFTEQTVKAILPLLSDRTSESLMRTGRLWGVVILANMVGTFAAACFATLTAFSTPDFLPVFLSVAREFAAKDMAQMFLHGVPAGFLMAALVWMLPNAEGSKFWIIIAVTYVIALGEFAHVVAGATEIFLLLLAGELSIVSAVFEKLLPAFVGNVVGGTALFSLIAYAQVSEEI